MKKLKNKTGEYCDHHTPVDLPYLAWHDWAEWMHRRGRKQKRCPVCKKVLFPCEWGKNDTRS